MLFRSALWVHQYHDVVNLELLDRVLASPDFHARAAATRVLCYWRDRVPNALDRLKKLAADSYPRVRLEAVRAASFFPIPEAVEVPLISSDHPTDEYLDYTRGETMKTLEPYWRKAIAEGKPIPVTSEAGSRFFLSRISTDELRALRRINIVASGTSRHAGMAGQYMIQDLVNIPVDVDYASEFEYRNPKIGPAELDRKSTRLNSSHRSLSRMPSSA